MDSEERFDPAVVNDVETARLALRWALDRIRGLQDDLTRASKERDEADADRRKLADKAAERDRNDREWRAQARQWEREALELELRDQLKGEILSEEGARWKEERAVLERTAAALRADLEHSEAAVERARKETLERERSARSQFEAELRKLDLLRQSELDERARMLEERFRGREAELSARFREVSDREAVLEDRLRQRAEAAEGELKRRRAEIDEALSRRDKELLAEWELRRQELDRSNDEKLRAELRRLEAQVVRERESLELERRSLEQTARIQEQEFQTRRAAIEAEAKRWTRDLDEARERLSSEKAETSRRVEEADRRAAARIREAEDRFDKAWRERELELNHKTQAAVDKMRADYDKHVQEALAQAQGQLLEKDRQFAKLSQEAALKNEQLLHELRTEAEARVERVRLEFVELERKNREHAERRIEDEVQRRQAAAQADLAARTEALEHARAAADAEFEARRKELADEALLFQERREEIEQRRRDTLVQEQELAARLAAFEVRSREFEKRVDETIAARRVELEQEEAQRLKVRLDEADAELAKMLDEGERELAAKREQLEREHAEKVEAAARERLAAQEAEHAARLEALGERDAQIGRRLEEAAADRKKLSGEREILKKEQESFQHMAAQRQKELADASAAVARSQAQLQKALQDKEKEVTERFLRREAELSTKYLAEIKGTGQKVESEFAERYKEREERLEREKAAAEELARREKESLEQLKSKMDREHAARMEALEAERKAWLETREHEQGLSEADRKRLEAERAEWLAGLEKERRDFKAEVEKREALFAEREKALGANLEERLAAARETDRQLIEELERQVAGERAAYNELKDRSEEGLERREKELETAEKAWQEKRKLAENKLAQARDVLMAQDAELQRRHKEVSDALNLKDLVFGIAHQIRNPLGVIKSHAQFCLGRKDLGKEEGEALNAILRSTDKLGQRLEELIDFTKPLPQHPKPMAATACVEQVLALVQEQYQRQGIQVEKRVPEGLPNVQVDPDLLIEALLHVVLNSIEAMPKGGRLALELTRDEAGAAQKLRVSDNGQGILEQNLKEVFVPFFSTKPGAVGLGLPIARRLLVAMGGDIALESAYGKGTAVTLTLPEKPPLPHG